MIIWVASMPSMPGIRMSMTTTSGRACRASWTASAPVPASPTTSRSRAVGDEHAQARADQRLVVGEYDPNGHGIAPAPSAGTVG